MTLTVSVVGAHFTNGRDRENIGEGRKGPDLYTIEEEDDASIFYTRPSLAVLELVSGCTVCNFVCFFLNVNSHFSHH